MASTGILPGHWYYNTESGELTHGNNLENLGNNLFGGLGWHELHISGNASEAQAAAEAKKEFPKGKTPTTSLATGAANTTGITGIGSYLDAIKKVFAWISNRNNTVRIVKVVGGSAMILVGINMLVTRESSVVNAAETVAGTVAKGPAAVTAPVKIAKAYHAAKTGK